MRKKIAAMLSFLSLTGLLLVAPSSTASAASCVPVKATGKTVGQLDIGSVVMPIKAFNYQPGGVMEPQKSTMMAAVSLRHMPLSSTMGTSVIVWHVNYGGCTNTLNALTTKALGYAFKVTDETGKTKAYKLSKRYFVTKGDYQDSWFDLIGPRKLLLVTCTGAFKNGHYESNVVLIATPK